MVKAAMEMALATNAPYDIVHRIVVDGECRWVQAQADFIFDEQCQPISCVGTSLDVTNIKEAEIALRRQEAFTRATLDGQSAQICVINGQGEIITTSF
jgi:PAS domain-containing protein